MVTRCSNSLTRPSAYVTCHKLMVKRISGNCTTPATAYQGNW